MRLVCISPYDPREAHTHAGGVFLQSWLKGLAPDHRIHVLVPATTNSMGAGDWAGVRVVPLSMDSSPGLFRRIADGLGPSNAFLQALLSDPQRSLLDGADLVDVHWPSMLGVVPTLAEHFAKPISYVAHDLRSEALMSQLLQRESPKAALAAGLKLGRCLLQEVRAIRKIDVAWCFKTQDANLIQRFAPSVRTELLEPSFSEIPISKLATPSGRVVGFVGDLSKIENRVALRWFLRKVWPRVRAHVPDAEFRVYGGGADGNLLTFASGPGVTVVGWVDDLADAYREMRVAVVPLKIRGGIKFKVAEAFAHGTPVIASKVGAAGYPPSMRNSLIIAVTSTEWVSAVERLLLGAAPNRDDAEYLRGLIRSTYDYDRLLRRVGTVFEKLATGSPLE